MDEQRLQEIEARAEKATPGPWEDRTDILDLRHFRNADEEFVSHAREDIPELVAELRRLQAIVDRRPPDDGPTAKERSLQAWAAAWKAAAKRYHQAAHKSICVYCGEEGPKELDWISEHIVSCEKRPEKELVQVIVNAVDTVKAFEAENARLRECIEAVEYYESYDVRCPWCGYHPYDGHRKDCQRQRALAGEG